jgi:hypothetical protein
MTGSGPSISDRPDATLATGERIDVLSSRFPQESPDYGRGSKSYTAHNLAHYLVAFDEIEEQTGLDFFYQLPEETQLALEAVRASRLWKRPVWATPISR